MNKEEKKEWDHNRYIAHKKERAIYARKYYLEHKEQARTYRARWRAAHKEYISAAGKIYRKNRSEEMLQRYKANGMKSRYGITPDDYDKMLLRQDGRCAICGKDVCELSKKLYIDHDHVTGKVRGLLCSGCNVVLGSAHEDRDVFLGAIEYLEKFSHGE
jgi:hypothetical protein